jgi:hypothetical protein
MLTKTVLVRVLSVMGNQVIVLRSQHAHGQAWVAMKGVHGTVVVVQALLPKLSLFSTLWPGLGTDEMYPPRLIG